jgi:uncharacterized pyridoxal phosphate-containing UPF0001 family protein
MGTNAQRYSMAYDRTCTIQQSKYMAPFVQLVHGVDSLKLLQEVNKQAAKNERLLIVYYKCISPKKKQNLVDQDD